MANSKIHRVKEEMLATWNIARTTSLTGAAVTLLGKLKIQQLNRNGWQETTWDTRLLQRKHHWMQTYLRSIIAMPPCPERTAPCPQGPVWLCWWQGEEKAPDLVKACVSSVRRQVQDRPVVVLTEENYREYAAIPRWMEEKFLRGVISATHFSDILRLYLLAEHGGIWLDATVFCTGRPDGWDQPLWTVKRPGYAHGSPAVGRFATYAMGCDGEHRWIFALLRDLLLSYWESHDHLMDYLVLDYLMVLAMEAYPEVEEAFRAVPPNEPACDELYKILAEPFDAGKWDALRRQSCLFKLTRKQAFPREKQGKPTFYAMLTEEKR